MSIKAVLFDFHFTLATCNSALDIEVKDLARKVLQYFADQGYIERSRLPAAEDSDRWYSELRARDRASASAMALTGRMAETLAHYGFDVPDSVMRAAVAQVMDACLADVLAANGAQAVVPLLHSRGYKLGLVSSTGYTPSVEMGLAHLGLRSYFDLIVTTESAGLHKSNSAIYRQAVEQLGLQPHEVVHVGDDPRSDIEPAAAAGLHTIWLTALAEDSARYFGRDPQDDRQRTHIADAWAANLEEIPAIIERLQSGAGSADDSGPAGSTPLPPQGI